MVPLLDWSSPLTCPARETLPVATLPPAELKFINIIIYILNVAMEYETL
jgi:hypothetical protein